MLRNTSLLNNFTNYVANNISANFVAMNRFSDLGNVRNQQVMNQNVNGYNYVTCGHYVCVDEQHKEQGSICL